MPERANDRPYRPIDCALHDRLEAAATLGRTVRIAFRTEGDGVEAIEDRIVDVFARDGAEFVRTAGGRVIRLDRLESVDGTLYRD